MKSYKSGDQSKLNPLIFFQPVEYLTKEKFNLRSRTMIQKHKSHHKSLSKKSIKSQDEYPQNNYKQKKSTKNKTKQRYCNIFSHTAEDQNQLMNSLKNHAGNNKSQARKIPIKRIIDSIKSTKVSVIKRTLNYWCDYKQPTLFRYSYKTKQGTSLSTCNKPNQDSIAIRTNLLNKNYHMFAIADGHGEYGHKVSQFVTKNISRLMELSLNKQESIPRIFKTIFTKLHHGIKKAEIDFENSGTTLTSILIIDNHLYCANAGDSRAILVLQNSNKNWQIGYLSEDHKPYVLQERQRITKCGGIVQRYQNQKGHYVGPTRVWSGGQIQGLAMSRSIGDNMFKQVGVTFQPQIIHHELTQNDKFIIMGSDGLWQYVSNQQASKVILPYYFENNIQPGIQKLLNLARQRWAEKHIRFIDDISIIVIFLPLSI